MTGINKAGLFSRLQTLRSEDGKAWNEIASILEAEGYEENGKVLTANALRKRFAKWIRTEDSAIAEPSPGSEQDTVAAQRRSHFDWVQKNRLDSAIEQFEGKKSPLFSTPEEVIASSVERLVTLNNSLLEQIQESNLLIKRLEKRIEEQELKTSHTGIVSEEQSVTTRDLMELLKDITTRREQQMELVKEQETNYLDRDEAKELIDEVIEERVDAELKAMLSPEGSFAGGLAQLVDQRLRTIFSSDEPVAKTTSAGPGRGKKGKTHKKFSASLEEGLFERVKSLPGQFSGHLSRALEAYLSVVEEKKEMN
jgi:hypothetical protein